MSQAFRFPPQYASPAFNETPVEQNTFQLSPQTAANIVPAQCRSESEEEPHPIWPHCQRQTKAFQGAL